MPFAAFECQETGLKPNVRSCILPVADGEHAGANIRSRGARYVEPALAPFISSVFVFV